MKIFGELIKEKRTELGYSMRDLANKAGITSPYISDIENNKLKTPPADETLLKIASALNMSELEKNELLRLAALERTPKLIRKQIDENEYFSDLKDRYLVPEMIYNFINSNFSLFLEMEKIGNIASSNSNQVALKEVPSNGNLIETSFIGKEFVKYYNISLNPKYNSTQFYEYCAARCSKSYFTIKEKNILNNNQTFPNINLSEKMPMIKIPVYGSVCAGNGTITYGEITEYTYTSAHDYAEGMFSIRVKGDSMEPKIPDGAYVKVVPKVELSQKEIGVFIINGDEGIIKQFYREPDFVRLVSFNSNYRDIIVMPDREDFRIVGKVVSYEIKL